MIISGRKKFELRLADFDLETGDILRLEEWASQEENKRPAGRFIEKVTTYVRKIDLNDWIKQQPELLEKSFYVIQFD